MREKYFSHNSKFNKRRKLNASRRTSHRRCIIQLQSYWSNFFSVHYGKYSLNNVVLAHSWLGNCINRTTVYCALR